MRVRAEKIRKDFLRKGKGTNILTAVAGCDFSMEEGSLSVLMGRSGSGKSTLLSMLSGLLTPTEGRVFYGEVDLYAMPDDKQSAFRNRHIGFIPQGQSAVSSLSVLENILLPFSLFGEEKEGEVLAGELMERLGILSLKDAYPAELSGGELRRMALARALIRMPSVLFADEPTGDLDDENTKIVLDVLWEAAHKGGQAVLLVTHENEAKAYGDRVFRMDAGKIVQE